MKKNGKRTIKSGKKRSNVKRNGGAGTKRKRHSSTSPNKHSLKDIRMEVEKSCKDRYKEVILNYCLYIMDNYDEFLHIYRDQDKDETSKFMYEIKELNTKCAFRYEAGYITYMQIYIPFQESPDSEYKSFNIWFDIPTEIYHNIRDLIDEIDFIYVGDIQDAAPAAG